MGDSRIDSRIRELQEALLGAHAQVAGAVEELSETEAHQVPAPGEWTIAQLLAHIAEIQAFWTAKAILITQEDDPNITRTAVENDIREAAVTGQAHDSMADLLPRCQEANERAIQLIGGIDPAYLEPRRQPYHRPGRYQIPDRTRGRACETNSRIPALDPGKVRATLAKLDRERQPTASSQPGDVGYQISCKGLTSIKEEEPCTTRSRKRL